MKLFVFKLLNFRLFHLSYQLHGHDKRDIYVVEIGEGTLKEGYVTGTHSKMKSLYTPRYLLCE